MPEVECEKCGRGFETPRGVQTHRSIKHGKWLREQIEEMYIDQIMSPREIGEELGMARKTVARWVRRLDLVGKQPTKFHLEENGMAGPFAGYPRWTYTGTGQRVRVHRLQAIAAGADPYEVFGGEKSVDHINGCPLDNREENLRLMDKKAHGRKDGERSSIGHTHTEYLQALIKEPPEWAQNLRIPPEGGCVE